MNKKKILIAAAAAAVILIGGSFALYEGSASKWAKSDTMPSNITVNGINVSDMTKKKAKKTLVKNSNTGNFKIKEDGNTSISIPLDDTKYKIMSDLDSCVKEAGYFSYISHLFGGEYNIEIPMTVKSFSDSFNASLTWYEDTKDTGTTKTENAYVDKSTTEFKVVDEVYGDNLDRDLLEDDIKKAIASGKHSLDFDMEEYIEKPDITADSEEIQEDLDYCHKYLETEITYEFGSEKVTLTPEELDSILKVKDGKLTLKKKSAKKFVEQLSANYSTYYTTRQFKTTSGRTVTLNPGTYGYIIDQEKELKQLKKDVESGENVSREPVYSTEGYGRNGMNDIPDTYVEVDLTNQHMYYYKNGSLIVDSACVSGRTTADEHGDVHGTVCGVFKIAYKEKDATLKGGNEEEGTDYESEVKYWMPFFNGIGLHDASWRDEFGGTIYKKNGSHGCINLPESAAKKLFENVDAGTVVVVFY